MFPKFQILANFVVKWTDSNDPMVNCKNSFLLEDHSSMLKSITNQEASYVFLIVKEIVSNPVI